MGRPPKQIDPNLVEKLAMVGCTLDEISSVCECSPDTLERRFAEVMARGHRKGRISLRHRMYQAAVEEGNVKMMIHLAEQKPGCCTLGLSHRPANTTEPQQQSLDTSCTFAIPSSDGKVIVFKAGSDIIAQIHGETTSTTPPEDGGSSTTGE